MTSAFENLCGPGKPWRVEPPDRKEFGGLIRSGHARLRDALNTTLPTGLFGSTTCRPTVACLSDASGGVTIMPRRYDSHGQSRSHAFSAWLWYSATGTRVLPVRGAKGSVFMFLPVWATG